MSAERLDALLAELEELRGPAHGDRASVYERVRPDAQRCLPHVPLVHGSGSIDDVNSILAEGFLCSRQGRGKKANRREAYLGIDDVVYTAAGILYPDARVGFVFRPDIVEEPDGVLASPWDSGAICSSLRQDLPKPPEPQRRQLFERYSLPAPMYRVYLACYVASCYRHWWHYLDLGTAKPAFGSPCNALGRHARSRSFEVRIPSRIPVTTSSLLAVFITLRDQPLSPAASDCLRRLERAGVVVKSLSNASPPSLQRHIFAWVREHLNASEAR